MIIIVLSKSREQNLTIYIIYKIRKKMTKTRKIKINVKLGTFISHLSNSPVAK